MKVRIDTLVQINDIYNHYLKISRLISENPKNPEIINILENNLEKHKQRLISLYLMTSTMHSRRKTLIAMSTKKLNFLNSDTNLEKYKIQFYNTLKQLVNLTDQNVDNNKIDELIEVQKNKWTKEINSILTVKDLIKTCDDKNILLEPSENLSNSLANNNGIHLRWHFRNLYNIYGVTDRFSILYYNLKVSERNEYKNGIFNDKVLSKDSLKQDEKEFSKSKRNLYGDISKLNKQKLDDKKLQQIEKEKAEKELRQQEKRMKLTNEYYKSLKRKRKKSEKKKNEKRRKFNL